MFFYFFSGRHQDSPYLTTFRNSSALRSPLKIAARQGKMTVTWPIARTSGMEYSVDWIRDSV